MVTEMCPVQSWPGQNGKALRMPKLQSATLSPRRAHFNGLTDSVRHISPKNNKSGVSFLPEPSVKKKTAYARNGFSPSSKRVRYVHQAASFPAVANGSSATSSQTFASHFPARKSRPNTMGTFPSLGSPRSLPSQLSWYDALTRESTKFLTRSSTRNFTRDQGEANRQLHVGRQTTRINLKREPTILRPSTHGFHPRSHSPTYKNLIDVKDYLDAMLAKEIKEFIKTTEGTRARNNSVFTEAPSTVVTFQTGPDERRASSSMLNEYFEPNVPGIDSVSVGETDSLHSDLTESRESIGQSRQGAGQAPPRPAVTFHFDLTYLREHLNDRKLLNLDIDEIEKSYRSKHKPEKKKPKKARWRAPVDPSLLVVFPLKKRRRKRIKKASTDESAIAEEDESQLSSPEADDIIEEYTVDLTKTYSESVAETESEYDFEVESSTPGKSTADAPTPAKSIVEVPVTIDNLDEKMAQTTETLQSTFKKISEAEKNAAAEIPLVRTVEEEEEPPEPQPLTAKEKYKKMKDRMEKRRQQRAVNKESYLQYSLQLEQIKRMNDEFVDDDGAEGGNMLASMTFKKIDNIMKYKTKKIGRLGLEVPESDSDDSEAGEKESKEDGDADDDVTWDGEESDSLDDNF